MGVNRGEGGGPSRPFNWPNFLKPDILKLVLVLVIPAIVALLVTGGADTILDFYDYLLKPRIGAVSYTHLTLPTILLV